MLINHGASGRVGSAAASRPSARLPARSVASCHHSPRPIDTGNGEAGGALLACVIGLVPVGAMGMDEQVRCSLVPCICLDCLPVILRLPGNTSTGYAGRHRVWSRSGSIASPSASYPLRFRILCSAAPSRLISAVPIQSVPPACFAPLRPFRPVSFRSRSSSSAHALLASSPIGLPAPSHVLPVPPRGSSYPYRLHRFHAPPARVD